MGIKNWTVTAERTKSASARESYFHNVKHPNHKKTERIIDIAGSMDTTLNIIRNTEKRRLETALKGKGGRPPTEAVEFVLTLPKGIRPSTKQWQEMITKVVIDTAKKMVIPSNKFNGIVRAVLHQQKQDNVGKKGSGDHVHMMIGKFTNDGMYLPKLQQIGVLHTIKNSFNAAMLQTMRIDHKTYEAKAKMGYANKKRIPQWKIKVARGLKHIENAQNQIDIDKAELAKSAEALQVDYARELKKMSVYLTKIEKALSENDFRQLNRQTNRIKSVYKIALEMQQEETFKMTPELIKAQERINRALDVLNTKQKTQLPKFRI